MVIRYSGRTQTGRPGSSSTSTTTSRWASLNAFPQARNVHVEARGCTYLTRDAPDIAGHAVPRPREEASKGSNPAFSQGAGAKLAWRAVSVQLSQSLDSLELAHPLCGCAAACTSNLYSMAFVSIM